MLVDAVVAVVAVDASKDARKFLVFAENSILAGTYCSFRAKVETGIFPFKNK